MHGLGFETCKTSQQINTTSNKTPLTEIQDCCFRLSFAAGMRNSLQLANIYQAGSLPEPHLASKFCRQHVDVFDSTVVGQHTTHQQWLRLSASKLAGLVMKFVRDKGLMSANCQGLLSGGAFGL